MLLNTIRSLIALAKNIPVHQQNRSLIIGGDTPVDLWFTETSLEETLLRNFFETVELAELKDIVAFAMLGKSFYPDERWSLIRENVHGTKPEIIDYLMTMSHRLADFLKEGLIRFIDQANMEQPSSETSD